jgi:hypothetical protein
MGGRWRKHATLGSRGIDPPRPFFSCSIYSSRRGDYVCVTTDHIVHKFAINNHELLSCNTTISILRPFAGWRNILMERAVLVVRSDECFGERGRSPQIIVRRLVLCLTISQQTILSFTSAQHLLPGREYRQCSLVCCVRNVPIRKIK